MSILTKKKNTIRICSLKDAAFCPAGNNKSFTLLELIVVVIIVGVVTGLAFVGYQSTIENNKEKEAVVYLRSIYVAFEMYIQDNPAGFPSSPTYSGADQINMALNGDGHNRIRLPTVDIGIEFQCAATGFSYWCDANRPTTTSPVWALRMRNDFCFGKPFCQVTPCPSILNENDTGCPEDPDNP